jgi:hypothetical protein
LNTPKAFANFSPAAQRLNTPKAFANFSPTAQRLNTPKAFANFSPAVGAKRQPWEQIQEKPDEP